MIDGLDELDGDHSELVELLTTFTNCKLLVSSRPLNVFEIAFELVPGRQLRLQNHTRNDIRKFVRDQFVGWTLVGRNSERDRLADSIVEASQGVFLWTSLVI
ncbi:hypothetical protein BDV96DRAFT_606826 [Lophiotrema nucula]|uniref:NACHT domain-containing protein n=1 Tax=Lophiotrema nucula TaxID=690887 RepID=A0A6A5YJ68_9PLEO|nr:hypothetical protein BDV96DRAFT_606826 [Lophiotrema nucula]